MSGTTPPLSPAGGRPQPGPPRAYRFPRFERERLANGLQAIVAPVPRLPLATVQVLVDAGAATENPDDAGVAHLTSQGLAEGTQRAGGTQLAEEFERLGGSLSTAATWDGIHLTTSVPRGHFEAALGLMAEVIRTPAFPEREVERLRDERLAELLELRSEPRGLANERFTSVLYEAGSRYALPESGSEDQVRLLARPHCVSYHEKRFRPDAITVVVAGDVTLERALSAVRAAFDDWSGTMEPGPRAVARPAQHERTLHVINRPGAPQTELRLGHIGIPRLHPDYFSVVVMNAILGGVFNSRINLNLRERHGFTYGASSGFDWRREAGPFVVSTAVATAVTSAAIREILSEIEAMRSAPPTAEELSLVTSYLDGVFPIRFETTEAIAAALTSLQAFGLPSDYYDTYRDHIRRIQGGDVNRAATMHLHPDQLQIVAVGDPDGIGPELEALALGPVRYWTAEGTAIAPVSPGGSIRAPDA